MRSGNPYSLVRLISLAAMVSSPAVSQRVITTVAGTDWVFPANGKPAADTPISSVSTLAVDSQGNIYCGDPLNYVVLKIDRNSVVTVVAGNGIRGFSGDGGPALSASLDTPTAVAVDGSGNLFVADKFNYRIRRITPDGIITTVAGAGWSGFSGDAGPAINASFSWINDIRFDTAGNLYVLDSGNNRVRRIDSAGIVTTYAGNGQAAFSGDGGPAIGASLNDPTALAFDRAGNLYIAEWGNSRIRRVSPGGTITTFAGAGYGFSGDGGPATDARLGSPFGIAFDGDGNLYIGDTDNSRIRMVTPQGIISTVAGDGSQRFAGDGSPPPKASFFFPSGLTFDAAGSLLVADRGNHRIRRIMLGGTVSTVAGNGAFRSIPDGTPAMAAPLFQPGGVALDATGSLYIADSANSVVWRINPDRTVKRVAGTGVEGLGGDNTPATSSLLSFPRGITLAPNGDLVIADRYGQRVRRVGSDGVIRTIAGTKVQGYFGDGGPAAQANLNLPSAVAYDAAGNLYIAEEGNHRIRKVTPGGTISTFAGSGRVGSIGDGGPATAASLNTPTGVAVDSAGNVYIGEYFGYRIRRVGLDGIISTIAGAGRYGSNGDGGPAVQALLGNIYALTIDSTGALYFSEASTHKVRRITPDGIISTVAGNGKGGFFGDGGPAASATLNIPNGLAVDAAGTLYIADSENNRIRAVIAKAPDFTISTGQISFTVTSGASTSAAQTVSLNASLNGSPFSGTPFTTTVDQSSARWLQVAPATGILPATLQVIANPAGLAPGSYQGTLTIAAPGAVPPVRTVVVTVTVQSSTPARLSVDTQGLSFSFLQGAASATSQFTVSNIGSGSLAFTAAASTASGGNWLSVSPGQGTATPSAPAAVTVTADASGLSPGTYTGSIRIATDNNAQASVPVSITVTAPRVIILLSQTGLTFTAVAQGGAVLPQTVGILNIGQSTMNWTAKATTLAGGSGWLTISSGGGRVPRPYLDVSLIDVGVNAAGLAPGDYYGQVQVSAPGADNSPQTVAVVLNVLPAGSNPGPVVRPTGLIFTGVAGSNPGSQSVAISNLTARPVGFNSNGLTLDGGNWFTHVPRNTTVTPDQAARLVVQPDFTVLDAGVWRGQVNMIFDDGSSRAVNLLTVVAPGGSGASGRREAAGACTPSQLLPQFTSLPDNFTVAAGQPTSVEVRVVDNCGSPVTSGLVMARFTGGDPSINLVHTHDGFWSNTWQTRADPGTPVKVEVDALTKYGTRTVGGITSPPRAGTVGRGASTPLVSPAGIVNGASFIAQAPVAPGSLISIFGTRLADGQSVSTSSPLSTELGGTQVVLSGRALPLLYASDGQLNVQVPYDLPVNTEHQLLVQRGAALSVPLGVTVAAAQPAIFTKDQSGKGQGAIVNGATQALAEAGTPVKAGDTVVIYCQGLGAVDPPVASGAGATGLSRTVNPVTVTIDGRQAAVSYSGLTPGYPGLYQVNAVVPDGVTAGDAVAVVLSVAGQTSPAVTMALR